MAALQNLPPAPTYSDVVLIDDTKKPSQQGYSRFNPVWLRWFLDAVAYIQSLAGGSIEHNATLGLQGGTTNEYYHFTSAEHTSLEEFITTQTANKVFAGPAAGAAAIPTFRSLVAADLPGISATITTAKLTGGGANGSMTFVNGLLTAQTPAT